MDVKIDDLSRQYHDLQEQYRQQAPDYADKATLLQSKQSQVEARVDSLAHELEQPDYSPGPKYDKILRIFSGELVIPGTVSASFTVPVVPEFWTIRLVSAVATATGVGSVTIEQQLGDYITLFVPGQPCPPDWIPIPGLAQNLKLTLTGATGADVFYLIYAVRGYDWMNFRS